MVRGEAEDDSEAQGRGVQGVSFSPNIASPLPFAVLKLMFVATTVQRHHRFRTDRDRTCPRDCVI